MTAEENAYRKSVFMMNLAKINAHNADKTQTYTMGINQFSDLTQDEFVSTYLGASVNKKFTDGTEGRTLVDSPIVGDVDWTSVGKVTEVKNQGGCGSCWAFSAVGAIESAYLIQKGATLNLAEQQLVDCSRSYGNNGCGGGWMDSAFAYVRDHGLVQTSQYAYVARDQTCKIDSGEYRVSGFKDVAGCENLSNALSTGPVSVAVDATNWSPYRDGIFNNCATNVNHGVLVVGETGSYWKVKNSWSTSWGEKGFIRVAKGNTCAICTYPSYPTL